MPKITIIGNSAAGDSCLKELLNKNNNEISVVSAEDAPPYRRDLLIDYIAGRMEEKQLFLCAEDFYEKNKISFYKNNPVTRIDTKKKRTVLKDNTKIDYDYLVVACGQKAELPDIPGKAKDGVFALYSLEDAKEIKQRLSISQHTCLSGDVKLCLALAEVLRAKEREVKIISTPVPEGFTATEKSEWIEGLKVQEIIGEGAELKALKLENGKALAASLIVFCGNFRPATDFLKDSGIELKDGYIVTGSDMRANQESVFACGSVNAREGNILQWKAWADSAQEGLLAAQSINSIIERG